MPHRASHPLPRRLFLGVTLLGAAGCMPARMVNAPPKSVVFFTAFSADLDDGAHQVINQVAIDAQANPGRSVIVEGYADRVGTATSNQTLSQLRAQVVGDTLVAHGVDRRRIVIRPRGPTDADAGLESRRVEVSFGA